MKSPVEQYIQKAKNWQEEMTLLRIILLECNLTEVIKWGKPCYTLNDKNIVIIQDFKNHCDLGFFNGASLTDLKQLLIKPGVHTQSARQFRFDDLENIKKKRALIKAYIKEAIENEKKGIKITVDDIPAIEQVVELTTIFKKNKAFEKAFNKLTPGRQRAYHMFFTAAKQSETRISRIEKFIPRILDGKGMTDCTCGLSKRMPTCDGSHKYLRIK